MFIPSPSLSRFDRVVSSADPLENTFFLHGKLRDERNNSISAQGFAAGNPFIRTDF